MENEKPGLYIWNQLWKAKQLHSELLHRFLRTLNICNSRKQRQNKTINPNLFHFLRKDWKNACREVRLQTIMWRMPHSLWVILFSPLSLQEFCNNFKNGLMVNTQQFNKYIRVCSLGGSGEWAATALDLSSIPNV